MKISTSVCSWHPFTQMAEWAPLVIASGDGSFLVDVGQALPRRRQLAVVQRPRASPPARSIARCARRLDRVAHSTFLGLTHEPGIRLAAELLEVAPRGLSRVFYSDSGSTAVEIALKQSFQYWQLVGRTTKQRFLRAGDAYHGDTLGAVGVGGIDLFHRVFGPLLVQSIAIPSPAAPTDARARRARAGAVESRAYEIAAFVLEPLIQGAAGMLVHPRGLPSPGAPSCARVTTST